MSPRTKKQFEEIRECRRRKILDAAIECFATKGYHAVSISELASHAGISKGLLYNYYTSKDELLKHICRESESMMMNLLDPDHTGVLDRTKLLQFCERFFSHLKSNLILWKMYMAIFSQPTVMLILNDELQESAKVPLGMVEQYFKKQGYKDPANEMAFLSTLTSGVIFEYISDPEHYPLDQIKKRILSFY